MYLDSNCFSYLLLHHFVFSYFLTAQEANRKRTENSNSVKSGIAGQAKAGMSEGNELPEKNKGLRQISGYWKYIKKRHWKRTSWKLEIVYSEYPTRYITSKHRAPAPDAAVCQWACSCCSAVSAFDFSIVFILHSYCVDLYVIVAHGHLILVFVFFCQILSS